MPSAKTWSLVGGVSAAGGGAVAKKLLHRTWKAVTGKEPPANPEHPSTTWAEAVAYALLSGALMGLARLLARRLAAGAWERRTGALPPGLEDVE